MGGPDVADVDALDEQFSVATIGRYFGFSGISTACPG